jgi:hypothetical protein
MSLATSKGNGGIHVTEEMLAILRQPGYLGVDRGGQNLRTMYQDGKTLYRILLASTA